tara:strand:- start:265 stop:441 length:177 start_codon:yes stop_codon:yes gene_type:complete
MIKYRIFSKEVIVDNMDEEEALTCVEMLRQNNPDKIYDVEKYNWSHVEKRLGRDPDLH